MRDDLIAAMTRHQTALDQATSQLQDIDRARSNAVINIHRLQAAIAAIKQIVDTIADMADDDGPTDG